jgi:hypothetical protein
LKLVNLIPWVLATLIGSAQAAERYVISVGNNLGNSSEPALQFAEKDASKFAEIMRDFGRIPVENIILLRGKTAQDFHQALNTVSDKIQNAPPEKLDNSLLIIFFSGHADAIGLHLGHTNLPFEPLKKAVVNSSAKAKLLILDSCRSGGITQVKGATAAEEFDIRLQDQLETQGFAVITSSASGEDSQESNKLQSSFFSHHLFNALIGAGDQDQDFKVTLDEAYYYAYRQTLRSSGCTLQLQHPTFEFALKGKSRLVLTNLLDEVDQMGQLIILQQGHYLIMEQEESSPIFAELHVDTEKTQLFVPPGRYFVQQRKPDHLVEYDLVIKVGEKTRLDSKTGRLVQYARLVRKGGGSRNVSTSLFSMIGMRPGLLSGEQLNLQLGLGGTLDLAWFSMSLRGRFNSSKILTTEGQDYSDHFQFGLDATLQRFLDFGIFSFSLGIIIGTSYHNLVFENDQSSDRSSWSFSIGGLASAEVEIVSALAFMVEGGPLLVVFKQGVIEHGEQTHSQTKVVPSWQACAGISWRF